MSPQEPWDKLIRKCLQTLVEIKTESSLVAQLVKNPPAMQESWVLSLCWEDSLDVGMATPSSILAWRIPTDRGAWRASIHGVAESDTAE